jgi:hypothetical protein
MFKQMFSKLCMRAVSALVPAGEVCFPIEEVPAEEVSFPIEEVPEEEVKHPAEEVPAEEVSFPTNRDLRSTLHKLPIVTREEIPSEKYRSMKGDSIPESDQGSASSALPIPEREEKLGEAPCHPSQENPALGRDLRSTLHKLPIQQEEEKSIPSENQRNRSKEINPHSRRERCMGEGDQYRPEHRNPIEEESSKPQQGENIPPLLVLMSQTSDSEGPIKTQGDPSNLWAASTSCAPTATKRETYDTVTAPLCKRVCQCPPGRLAN